MTLLEKIQSMKMPFAQLKGVTFKEAELDRVAARMLVRPDLCTLHGTIHGGAVMAFADSVGAAATVINLPSDAKGITTIESKTNFIGGAKEGTTVFANGDNITISELLKMRSGLFNYTPAPELAESLDHDPARVWTTEELLAIASARLRSGNGIRLLQHQLCAARSHRREG